MIKVIIKQYIEGDFAVRTEKVTFLCIPIYKRKEITSDRDVIEALTPHTPLTKIKGFYETKD